MKNAITLILLIVAVFSFSQANAGKYSVDEGAIDQLFTTATETSMISMNASNFSANPSVVSSPLMANAKEKDAVVAIVLDFFLGGLGIHRFYLGTETLTGLAYPLTCGGIFGIVPLIDFVVLIINNEDISPFIDNPKFFMW
ncbi:MAG TPA: TM2 domain-containing protein [Prolixibacteraceae bacterium]|nr:TM2 domain-containing protein [Prolixibacteraceae bacterium]